MPWYFIPWDFDKALGRDIEMTVKLPDWQLGIQRYWGTVLHKRYLRDPNNVEKLSAKIEELSEVINESTTREMMDTYYPIVKPFILRNPDLKYMDIEAEQYDDTYNQLQQVVTRYKNLYYESIEYPMPIFLHYERKDGNDTFSWEASHDLQGDTLAYHFQLGTDPAFQNVVSDVRDVKNFNYEIKAMKAGRYYWRVLVEDGKGHTQIPFDYYLDSEAGTIWGVQEIIVPKE